jgi:hypothetical protein
MPGRGAIVLLLLLFCGLLIAGCVSDRAGPAGDPTPDGGTRTATTPYPGENQTYAYARSLVPTEIPGFVLQSRAKEPLTIWEDPYHFHSYWTPANTSAYNGSVRSLSVDVFVYDDSGDAFEWIRAFEADSDGPVAIRGINASYRFRGGVAEIAFMTDDIVVHSSAIAESRPTGSVSGEEAAQEAAVTGAEMLIQNIR